jgi:PAS domain S-box-containing protein
LVKNAFKLGDTKMKKEQTPISKPEMLNALMDNIPDSIYFKDLESRFIRVSKALIGRLKINNTDEALGKTDFDFFTKEHAAKALHDEQYIINSGMPLIKLEEKETYAGREDRWVSTTKMPLYNKEGKVIGTFGISRDITDIKKSEKELKHLNSILRAIRDIDQLIVKEKNIRNLTENACKILTGNHGYYDAGIILLNNIGRITEYAEVGTGKNFISLVKNLEKGRTINCWEKAINSSEVVLITNPKTDCIDCPLTKACSGRGLMLSKLVHGKKAYGILSASIPLEYIENKQEQELFGEIANDIAFALHNSELEQKRKKTEEKLRIAKIDAEKSLKKAQAADSAKSEFLANMSHEIRTPMNAILGFSEILKEQLKDPKYIEYTDTIIASGKTLLGLINDILDLSKIEAGKVDLQYRPVDPHSLFGDITKIFATKIKNKGLKFITDIDEKLPESLLLDEVRIRQILFNLVGNAAKFTTDGYIELKVKKVFHPDRSKIDLIFSVKDTGIGISVEDKKIIFDAFRQSKGQSTKIYGGTGLGLAITKKLAELMNGEITLESTVGKGSIFTVKIKEVSVASVEHAKDERKTDIEDISFCNQKVLVVDDIQSNRLLLSEILSIYGLAVLEATNGKEAINIIKSQSPDLVLMDLRMPVMDGYEAIKILKGNKRLKNIPVIVLTASAMKTSEEDIRKIGGDGYLRKPISRPQLLAELKKYLKYKIIPKDETMMCSAPEKANAIIKTALVPVNSTLRIKKSPELINILENEIFVKYGKLKKEFIINDIEDFAEEMQELGSKYSAEVLSDWGKKLSVQSNNFDFENLTTSLNEYESILSRIKVFK